MNSFVVDPVVDRDEAFKEYSIEILETIPHEKKFKAIIIAVEHNQFKLLEKSNWEKIKDENSVLIDIKNILPNDVEAIRL